MYGTAILYNEMGYFINLEWCALKKKITYSIGRFYILRKYIWYEGTYKAYKMFESWNTIYQILSNYIECLGCLGSTNVVYRIISEVQK